MGGIDEKQDINNYLTVNLIPFGFKLLEDTNVIYEQS